MLRRLRQPSRRDTNDDVAALGVRHRHQRDCGVSGTYAASLALEPLALGQADELLYRLVGRQREHTIDVTRMHAETATLFQLVPVGEYGRWREHELVDHNRPRHD